MGRYWLDVVRKILLMLIPDFKEQVELSNKYECLNEAKSWSDGMKKNNFPKIKFSSEQTILSDCVDLEPEENEKGGIIVFSTDVNTLELSPDKIINWLKQKNATLPYRCKSINKIDGLADNHQMNGWAMGHYLDSKYKAKNGKVFGENSLSVEIIGVNCDELIRFAEDVCMDFKQESLLVRDFSSARVLFVNPD